MIRLLVENILENSWDLEINNKEITDYIDLKSKPSHKRIQGYGGVCKQGGAAPRNRSA